MIKQFKYKNVTWVDLTSPTQEEVENISKEFKIHPVAAGELRDISQRSKIDIYDDFIYLILYLPNHTNNTKIENTNDHNDVEIDFIIGKDFLVTTTYKEIDSMQEFGKILETNNLLEKDKKKTQAGYLFYYIIKHLYQSLERNLQLINHNLKKAENQIFTGQEKEMVVVLSSINKKLLDFRGTLKSHQGVLATLEASGQDFFGDKFNSYILSIKNEFNKVWYALENSREYFNELRQTNESLLQIKTNEATKTFTMLAFITFPLSLLVAVFGLRTDGTPLIDIKYGFWYLSGIIIALILLILA